MGTFAVLRLRHCGAVAGRFRDAVAERYRDAAAERLSWRRNGVTEPFAVLWLSANAVLRWALSRAVVGAIAVLWSELQY